MIRKLLAGLAIAAATLAPGLMQNAHASEYPERPITVIVPFGAGGEADIVGRLLATEMSKILGQNVAVQNIVGASGLNGMNAVATAKPDGYTLGFCPSAPPSKTTWVGPSKWNRPDPGSLFQIFKKAAAATGRQIRTQRRLFQMVSSNLSIIPSSIAPSSTSSSYVHMRFVCCVNPALL